MPRRVTLQIGQKTDSRKTTQFAISRGSTGIRVDRATRDVPRQSSVWHGSSMKDGRQGSSTGAYWIAIAAEVRPCRSTMIPTAPPAPSRAAAISASALQGGQPVERGGLADRQTLHRAKPVGPRLCRLFSKRTGARTGVNRAGPAASGEVMHPQPLATQPSNCQSAMPRCLALLSAAPDQSPTPPPA